MKTAILLTENGLELPCVVLPVERYLPFVGKEVIAYCQSRLVKGLIMDEQYVIELEKIVEFAIIPELEELLKELEDHV
jgi:hypothetical protein